MAYSAYRCYLTPLGALLLFSFLSSLPFNYLRFAAFIYAPTALIWATSDVVSPLNFSLRIYTLD